MISPAGTQALCTPRFEGRRFEQHQFDVECTAELLAYRKLVLECAKELWRRTRPGRVRLPRGFEDGFRLAFDRAFGVKSCFLPDKSTGLAAEALATRTRQSSYCLPRIMMA